MERVVVLMIGLLPLSAFAPFQAQAESHREKVNRIEEAVSKVPQVDCPVKHYFAPGLFARQISIPAGTILIGAVHKVKNLAVLSKGRMVLATEAGPVEIEAGAHLEVEPGAKNAATALEDCVWTNFYPNPDNETDIAKLAERFTESTLDELLGGCKNKQLLYAQKEREAIMNTGEKP